MLAAHLSRLSRHDPERYARPLPPLATDMHPLEALAHAQLSQMEVFPHTLRPGALARRPGGKEATAAYRDVVHGGDPARVLDFLLGLHGSGLVRGRQHGYLGEQIGLVRNALANRGHPVLDVFAPGDALGRDVDEAGAQNAADAVRRVLYHLTGGDRQAAGSLARHAATGSLHGLLALTRHLHRTAMPPAHVMDAWGHLANPLWQANARRLRLIEMATGGLDSRPQESLPEDYYAHGA